MMLRRWLTAGIVTLMCLSVQADDMPLFVNGVKVDIPHVASGPQTYYPLEELAKAMGVLYSAEGFLLNGQPLRVSPLMLDGKPWTTAEAACKTVGAVIVRDPVRRMVSITCHISTPAGLAYYKEDYKTPEQIQREERRKMLENAGSPGDALTEEKWKEWGKMYPTTNKALDRTVRPPVELNIPAHPSMSEEDNAIRVPDGSPDQPSNHHLANHNSQHDPGGFLAKIADNGIYRITVTNVRVAEALKGLGEGVRPQPGHKFVVVYLTEENISKQEQKTAWFALRDQAGNSYAANHGLSQFSQAPLRSREITTGYVIVEIPLGAQPSALELLCNPPLSVSLLL